MHQVAIRLDYIYSQMIIWHLTQDKPEASSTSGAATQPTASSNVSQFCAVKE